MHGFYIFISLYSKGCFYQVKLHFSQSEALYKIKIIIIIIDYNICRE